MVAPPLQAPKNKLAHVAPDPNRARFEAAGLNGRRIYTLFANCNNDRSLRDSYYNWIAEWRLGSPRIHCELYFPDGFESFPGVPDYVPNGPASFSVTKQHGATWTFHKDFLNIEWETLMHTVTPTQYERVRVLLNDYKGMPFDHFGFLMGLFFKNAACTSTDHAFCSRVIAEVYGDPQVGLLTREECESPYEMTPPLLYNLLAPRSAVNAALPTRIRHIRNTEGNVFFSQ